MRLTRTLGRPTGRQRRERGQAALEFVLVLPLVLIMLFLVAEGTMMLQTWLTLEHASREGARFAAVGNTQTDVINRTVDRSGGLLTSSNVTVTNAKGTPGTTVTVRVSYTYNYKFPLVGLLSLISGGTIPTTATMGAHTDMRLE